jgi:hypothetical protein
MVNHNRVDGNRFRLYWSRCQGFPRSQAHRIIGEFALRGPHPNVGSEQSGHCLFVCSTAHACFGGRRQLPNLIRNNRRPWRGQGHGKLPDKSEHAQNKYWDGDDDRSNHNERNDDLIFHLPIEPTGHGFPSSARAPRKQAPRETRTTAGWPTAALAFGEQRFEAGPGTLTSP